MYKLLINHDARCAGTQPPTSTQPTRPGAFFSDMSHEQLQGSSASGPIIDNTTPVERAMLFLVENGCNNLTTYLRPIDNHITPIAYGGACDVYKWGLLTGDPTYDFPIAIKTLRCSSAFNHEARLPKRASRELFTWLQFSHHPNILPLLGSAIYNGRLSMVSPWMSNGNLSAYLHKNEISTASRIAFCEQIRDGLAYMHSMGMAHGDMKPANVMVSDSGVAMIADFGNAFFKDLALSFAPTSTFPVTCQYAPPEHLLKTPIAATEQSDVYSYGMEILSGEVPFSGRNNNWILLQALRGVLFPNQPSSIDSYIWSKLLPCWDSDPSKRPSISTISLRRPAWPSSNSSGENDEDNEESDSEKSEDDDPEGVKHAMCTTVTPDANVESNVLPFVLQSYAQWVNFIVFDPKNVVHVIREGVIAQFSSSQDTRTRVILLSNVFGALGKSPVLNSKVRSVVTYLSTEAHQSIARFTSTEPAPLREMDMMNALKSIDLMMEVILLRRFGGSISTIVGLMEAASPVFRCACPEPLGQLVNLPNILISPSINLRHYAEADIMNATLLARPMFLRYDILYTPEINELFMGQQAGLHWLHGIPDQLIILLAWINMLHEDLGTNVDPLLISQIEMEVERVKITPSTSDDPVYTIRRFAVRECWRLVVYIHLYVTLCGAHAEDPRVVKFVKRFIRLLGGIKPARTVDNFLFLPIMFIGSFVSRKQDRDLLFRRLTTMQECTMPGRAGHDILMVLCDIWKRTEQEQRPARWVDLRISCQTIAGV